MNENTRGTQHSKQIASDNGVRNTAVSIVSNRGNKNKIEGSKVFAQYNTAVFMVFTSDGYNMYQGSGFLSISTDWLLVITMYSKVQVLVKKVSNLRETIKPIK